MSLLGSTTAREARCNEIDTATKKLLEQVLTLKTQRNELALISCLPAEIMAKIFLLVRAECLCTRKKLEWITISHISTHWRNIAVDSAALWSRPPFGSNLWAAEMVRRSKLASLEICFDFTYERDRLNQTVTLLKQALTPPRDGCIRELVLTNVPITQQDFVNALPTNLPHLERLDISGCFPSNDGGLLLLVPDSLLSVAGKLSQLTISNCRMDWISHLPSSITNLRLDNVGTISDSTFLHFINALENMPELEKLKLKNSFRGLAFHDCSRHISLQKLRRLQITSSLGQAAMFFHHITFPPTARVFVTTNDLELESQMSPDITGTTADLLASMAQSYSHFPSDLTFRSVSLNTGIRSSRVGIVLSMTDDQNSTNSSGILSLTLSGALFSDPLVYTRVLHEMFNSGIYMKDISFMSLTPGFTSRALTQTLGLLPNISCIRSSGTTAANDLIDALQLLSANPSDLEALCFPKVSTLELCKISFSDRPTARQPNNLPLSKLRDCLIWRHEHGARVTKLSLEDCDGLNDRAVNLDNPLEEIGLFGPTKYSE